MATDAAVRDKGLVIPLIDFSRFLNGSPAEKEATAKAMLHGFQSAGFIYLTNHPIPDDVLSRTYSFSAAFFRLPEADKLAISWSNAETNRGYNAIGREKISQGTLPDQVAAERAAAPDLKETYEMGVEPHPSLHNPWPAEEGDLKGFRAHMMDFYDRCQLMNYQVMVAIAIGMGLGPNFFDNFFDACDHQLRLLHYPEVKADVFRARSGQDYGSITLLFQDDRGGLQVKSPTGSYVDATPIPGTIVVNAGDLLARWSNDTIKSTLHRVVEPPRREGDEYPPRYSIAFFGNPNFNTTIDTLPGTFLKQEDKKYEGVNTGEYIKRRLAFQKGDFKHLRIWPSLTLALHGAASVYPVIGTWTRWTQTLAALEVLHSLLGIVRAPLFTTAMQVSSRYLLTWVVVHRYGSVSSSPAYSTMLLAWSFSEVVRYSYFVFLLSSPEASSPPAFVTRLRYNTFWVFYPMGIISECVLVYKATALCSQAERFALYAVLAIYVPGSYLLYSHMIVQRRKVMRSLKAKDEKATR
ncbi:hypothetical protein L249_7169 [Ophiocordyceps polyrhachis-furcata BCC 54312]|uniref:Very-long-chain (3R)-3-hydroxyacyl-CoA dehydratase n=1 Tax=Ophiocordyceps polyrhachis-furcata BCC 54312 TaxID=1330021 RepID=A0A367LAJ3_9HYPO|nr:hypothetical protein L249_7169 [Ophiocordyceps polyrhachis-furcata BCC 54312]